MKNILILFAHPAIEKSRINKVLIDSVKDIEGVTINELYENYPDFYIDIVREQQLLQLHDIIVWHHPFYWYNAPSLLIEWFDLVLQHGFAYGMNGIALEGKKALSVISTGGQPEVYSETGKHRYTINEFLVSFRQSAILCRMEYLPPFVVHGSHTISKNEISEYAEKYKKILLNLRDEKVDYDTLTKVEYINELYN